MTEADRRFRKNLVAACLVGAPLLIAIGQIVGTGIYDDDETTYLANIADNEARFYAGNMISVVGAFLIPGAVLGLVHLVRVRKRIFGTAVGLIALVGAFGIPGAWLAGSVFEYMAAQEQDRAAMASLLGELESGAALPLFFVWIGFSLGLLLLAVGLFLARSVPLWMAALLAISVIALAVSSGDVSGIAASLFVVAAWGAIAWSVFRRTPAEWTAGAPPGTPPPPVA